MRLVLKSLTLLLIIIGAWNLLRSHQEEPVKRKTAQGKPSPIFAIVKGQLFIDGKELPLPATAAQVEELLGHPSRRTGLLDSVTVWDELGVYTQAETGSGLVADVVFKLQHGFTPFEPHALFTSELTLDGAPITAETPLWEIVAAAKGPRIEELHLPTLRGYRLPAPVQRAVVMTISGNNVTHITVAYWPSS